MHLKWIQTCTIMGPFICSRYTYPGKCSQTSSRDTSIQIASTVKCSQYPFGGGQLLTPNFGRYVPRQSEKWAPGSGTSSRSSMKMRGSGTSLSRFELENAGLRNELDPLIERENATLWNCQDASGWCSGRLLNPTLDDPYNVKKVFKHYLENRYFLKKSFSFSS